MNAIGVFVVGLVGSLLFLALVPSLFGFRAVVVSSGSMAPALRTADIVVTGPPRRPLPTGAVINYRSGDRSIIHRIVEVTDEGYRTQGDANPAPDTAPVTDADIEGVGAMVVPFVGLPVLLADDHRWAELVGLTAALVTASVVSTRRWVMATFDTDAGD